MKRSIFILAVLLVMVAFSACNDHKKSFSGYIPVGEKPVITWVDDLSGGGHWSPLMTILVITTQGDSVRVSVPPAGGFGGSFCVIYRDSYPPAQGKKVLVNGYYDDDSRPVIVDASLEK